MLNELPQEIVIEIMLIMTKRGADIDELMRFAFLSKRYMSIFQKFLHKDMPIKITTLESLEGFVNFFDRLNDKSEKPLIYLDLSNDKDFCGKSGEIFNRILPMLIKNKFKITGLDLSEQSIFSYHLTILYHGFDLSCLNTVKFKDATLNENPKAESCYIPPETMAKLHGSDVEKINFYKFFAETKSIISLDLSAITFKISQKNDFVHAYANKCYKDLGDYIFPAVTKLDYSNQKELEDINLIEIPDAFPNLVELNISNCTLINGFAIITLIEMCDNLMKINVSDCNINEEGFKQLTNYCRENQIELISANLKQQSNCIVM